MPQFHLSGNWPDRVEESLVYDLRRGRYRCTVCQRTVTDRTGPRLAHKQTAPEIISRVVALGSHGCPIAAIEAAFDHDCRTVRRWVTAAGQHAERIHHSTTCSNPVTSSTSRPTSCG